MKASHVLVLGFLTFFVGYEGLVLTFMSEALSLGVQAVLFLRVGLAAGILLFGYFAYQRKGTVLSLFMCGGLVAAFLTVPLWTGGFGHERFVGAYFYGWYHKSDFGRLSDQPLTGGYDSNDRKIVEQQLAWAGQAGLDFLVLSGFIEDAECLSRAWSNAEIIFQVNSAVDSGVQLCFMLEPKTFKGLESMVEQVWNSYASKPAYFKYQSKPLLFVFSGYVPEDLPLYVERLKCFTVRITVEEPSQIGKYVDDVLSVTPGFDKSAVPDKFVSRETGEFYRDQWRTVLVLGKVNVHRSLIVMVTSWNEFYENSHVEPSQKYGYTYLNLTKEYASQFKG